MLILAIHFFNGGKAVRQIDTDSISAVTFDPSYSTKAADGYNARVRIKADKDFDLFFPEPGDTPGDAVKEVRAIWIDSDRVDSGWTDDPDTLFNFLVKGKFNL